MRKWCPPAAAISSARLTCSWPLTSKKSLSLMKRLCNSPVYVPFLRLYEGIHGWREISKRSILGTVGLFNAIERQQHPHWREQIWRLDRRKRAC